MNIDFKVKSINTAGSWISPLFSSFVKNIGQNLGALKKVKFCKSKKNECYLTVSEFGLFLSCFLLFFCLSFSSRGTILREIERWQNPAFEKMLIFCVDCFLIFANFGTQINFKKVSPEFLILLICAFFGFYSKSKLVFHSRRFRLI